MGLGFGLATRHVIVLREQSTNALATFTPFPRVSGRVSVIPVVTEVLRARLIIAKRGIDWGVVCGPSVALIIIFA